MSSTAAGVARQGGKDPEHKRLSFRAGRELAYFEALLPPLLFVLVMVIFGPLRTAYELGIDEGYNLMKAALVAEGFSLYSGIRSDQPPLLTLILALVHRLFPFNVEAARCIALSFSALLFWSLFRCVYRLEGRRAKDAYARYATLNDGVTSEAIVLLRGYRILGDERYLDAAKRGGEFLIKVQGAPPQPAWAQQYGADRRPVAARSFEPAAYGSEETGFAMNAPIDLYVAPGDERFLKGLDAARDWLERSAIRPGVWSRLYEIDTNRPIYGDRDGKAHYSLAELSEKRRTGYRWEFAFPSVTRALARYGALAANGLNGLRRHEEEAKRDKRHRLYAEATPLVGESLSRAVPGQGWVENDILSTPTFITNCNVLLDSLEFTGNDAGQL